MRNLIFLAIVLFISPVINAQIIDVLPTDENGKLAFSSVEEAEGTADQLYFRAKQFFVDSYKSANDVIQMDDKENALIAGKAFSDIPIKTLGGMVDVRMWYTIKIQTKDGRYKYDIYDIYYETYASAHYSSVLIQPEDMLDRSKYYRKNGNPRHLPDQYKIQTVITASTLAKMIKESMVKNVAAVDSGDW